MVLDIVSKSLCWETPLYKYLYANGCSWVDGDELQDRTKQRFSKLLSNDLNLEEINQAIAGCSNETIIKNTMDWIYENEKLLDETIFIIGFTAESRSKFDWNFYDIIMFQRFLESIDVNHILFFSFGKSHKDIFLDNFTDKPFYEVVSENTNKVSEAFCQNGHPNEKSHKKFAEYIKGYINV